MTLRTLLTLALLACLERQQRVADAFFPAPLAAGGSPVRVGRSCRTARMQLSSDVQQEQQLSSVIQSPFAQGNPGMEGYDSDSDDEDDDMDGYLPLTMENVDMVLDEMRPYLISDGGNVRVAAIEGSVVRLELQGACGSCPSSTMTMKMGLERRLLEKIPEISQVVQVMPDATPLTTEEIEKVLDGVRPFLAVAGGAISVAALEGVGGMQPRIALRMTGKSSALQSVRMEIMQRLQRHFTVPGLRIDWAKE
eukprot:TRINITY_DN7680_c0_g2_i3.p1 TRINITY_DN7680_c0_g2~~TRINITY_DN7680_c0_g2_i3.p1  ORF type:complete len:251 (+),score=87.24 TRINITY_DN7680_c0_g2_i3:153-905(+)